MCWNAAADPSLVLGLHPGGQSGEIVCQLLIKSMFITLCLTAGYYVKYNMKGIMLTPRLLCDCQAYLDELVELHKRLMTLREGHILQQVRCCH